MAIFNRYVSLPEGNQVTNTGEFTNFLRQKSKEFTHVFGLPIPTEQILDVPTVQTLPQMTMPYWDHTGIYWAGT